MLIWDVIEQHGKKYELLFERAKRVTFNYVVKLGKGSIQKKPIFKFAISLRNFFRNL